MLESSGTNLNVFVTIFSSIAMAQEQDPLDTILFCDFATCRRQSEATPLAIYTQRVKRKNLSSFITTTTTSSSSCSNGIIRRRLCPDSLSNLKYTRNSRRLSRCRDLQRILTELRRRRGVKAGMTFPIVYLFASHNIVLDICVGSAEPCDRRLVQRRIGFYARTRIDGFQRRGF
jgi:hypothetical protein